MQISNHYVGYPKQTLIVVTNNTVARFFRAFEKTIEEIDTIDQQKDEEEVVSDEQRQQTRSTLYEKLNARMKTFIKEGKDEEIILCVPGALKTDLLAQLDEDVQEAITEFIPKNLASLPLEAIVRILQEA